MNFCPHEVLPDLVSVVTQLECGTQSALTLHYAVQQDDTNVVLPSSAPPRRPESRRVRTCSVFFPQDGEPSGPLQKGDHVEYHTWRDKEGTLMAVRVEKIKDRTRSTGVGGGMGAGAQRRTDRAAPAHFR